ncbi:MAG: hypothetical protein ABEH77_03210 [Halobacteriaceae archaeon]
MSFDPALVAAVAEDRAVPAADLEAALEAVQELVAGHREVGGVDGLVYEWRKTYPRDPLVERTPDRYYLAVERRVWADFDRRLGLDRGVAEAVRAVHDRALRAAADPPDAGVPMVLERD